MHLEAIRAPQGGAGMNVIAKIPDQILVRGFALLLREFSQRN